MHHGRIEALLCTHFGHAPICVWNKVPYESPITILHNPYDCENMGPHLLMTLYMVHQSVKLTNPWPYLCRSLHLGPLYTRLGVGVSIHPIHEQLSPQSIRSYFINYLRVNLVTYKVVMPNFRPQCPWGESIVKRINLLWTHNRYDIHYPTNGSNPTHLEN